MENEKLLNKLTFYESYLENFIENGKMLKPHILEHFKLLQEILKKAKKHLSLSENKKKCEFFDSCKHKFIRPRNTIINHKEEDLDIKSWCTDLNQLKYISNNNTSIKTAKCVIRDEVLSVLVRGVY